MSCSTRYAGRVVRGSVAVAALVAAMLSVSVPRGGGPDPTSEPSRPEQPGSRSSTVVPADREILRKLFYVALGADKPVSLRPGIAPPIDGAGNVLEEGSPLYVFRMRGLELARAHQSLMQGDDPSYRELFHDLEREVVLDILPTRPDARVGQQAVYRRLEKAGLAVALVVEAGPPTLIDPPPGFDSDDDGSGPFIIGGVLNLNGVPEAAAPFHCCGGQLVVTDFGQPYSKYSSAHLRLYRNDPRYRNDFDAATEPFRSRTMAYGSSPSPAEHRDCEGITTDGWRRALADAGIIRRVEAAGRADDGS